MTKYLLILTLLISCATTKNKGAKIVNTPSASCSAVASFSAMGFNIFPPIATMIAKNMLKKKASEFYANEIVIDSKEGLFEVNIKATGYHCPN